MRWFRRTHAPSRPDAPEEPIEVGGDRIVFWKAKSEEVEGEIYGPVWIADANDPDVRLEEPTEWLTWEQAEEFARKRQLPIEDV
jgi:formylglycine-generating enzyme required for sulfatase activity